MDERLKGSLKSSFITMTAIIVIAAVFSGYAYYLMESVYPGMASLGSLSFSVAKPLLLTIPVIVISGVSGYYVPGDKKRLYWRIIGCAYAFVLLLLFSHMIGYETSQVILNQTYDVYASEMRVILDLSTISLILAAIPFLNIIDSLLEYRESTDSAH